MARADLLLNLVDAANRNDTLMIKHAVEAMAAEERAKNHHVLADQLSARIERDKPVPSVQRLSAAVLTDLWYERSPRVRLQDLVLTSDVYSTVSQVIEEQHRAELLRSHGLEPRNRILLNGPPGNGKTTLAEAIAESLLVPLIIPRYESIVGSLLGETSQRLKQLFDHVATRRCVLFLDEFDTVAKERADQHETGEIKRVVSSLLLQIDELPSHVVVVAATNHPELLDRAVWRRFHVRLAMPAPTSLQVREWFALFSRRFGIELLNSAAALDKRFAGRSFSDLEEFALDVLRQAVLAGPDGDMRMIIRQQLKRQDSTVTMAAPQRKSAMKNSASRSKSSVRKRK